MPEVAAGALLGVVGAGLGEDLEERVDRRRPRRAAWWRSIERAAYRRTWMVSMPARSLKNQPQRRVHEQRVALRVEEHAGLVPVADDVPRRRTRPTRRRRSAGRGSRRARPTGRAAARWPRRSNTSMPQSRSTSRACRSGPRHAWFQPSGPPVWQPQSAIQRCTPWAQDQALVRTPHLGGGRRLVEQVEQPGHPHAVGGLGDGQGARHDLVGAVVVVAEGLAVGGGDHEPAERRGRRR